MALEIRKLRSAEEIEKRRKRNVLIASIVLIAILVFSTAGYFSVGEENEETSSSKVREIGGEWTMDYNGNYLRFSSPPEAAENVSLSSFKTIQDYNGQIVYIDSESDAVAYQISLDMGRYVGRIQAACYGNCTKNLPEKNCTDSKMIIFRKSDDISKVYEEQNCVFIEGNLKTADAFLYRIFGVI